MQWHGSTCYFECQKFYRKKITKVSQSAEETEDGKTLEKKNYLYHRNNTLEEKWNAREKKENCYFSAKHTNKYQA